MSPFFIVLSILLTHQDGWNCLHLAAHGGHLDIVKDLVDQHHMNISKKTNVDCMGHTNAAHTCYTLVCMCCINSVFFYFLTLCTGFTFRRISQLFG